MRNLIQTNTNTFISGQLYLAVELITLLLSPIVAMADSSSNRPGFSPPLPFKLPDESLLRPYRSPVCADNMERSEVGVFNHLEDGAP